MYIWYVGRAVGRPVGGAVVNFLTQPTEAVVKFLTQPIETIRREPTDEPTGAFRNEPTDDPVEAIGKTLRQSLRNMLLVTLLRILLTSNVRKYWVTGDTEVSRLPDIQRQQLLNKMIFDTRKCWEIDDTETSVIATQTLADTGIGITKQT